MRPFYMAIVLVCACSSGMSTIDHRRYGEEANSSSSGGVSSSGGKGGDSVAPPCVNPDPNPCDWDCEKDGEKPSGCGCDAECPLPKTQNQCDAPLCVDHQCETEHLPEGNSCLVNTGVCAINGTCLPPIGVCNIPMKSAPLYCKTVSDCDDQNGCTFEADCVSGMCIRKPQLDVTICGKEQACNRGACCNWPKGACDPFSYPCGLDALGNGGLPIGTPCELNAGGDGLCGFYQCCNP